MTRNKNYNNNSKNNNNKKAEELYRDTNELLKNLLLK